jgi:PAS domain S-box-containing protein
VHRRPPATSKETQLDFYVGKQRPETTMVVCNTELEGEVGRLRSALHECEADRRRLAAELAVIYRALRVGLCELDTELRYVRINEPLAQMNGRPIEAHLGKTVRDIVPEVAGEIEPLLRRVLTTGAPIVGIETRARTARDPAIERIWMSQYWPLKSDDGNVYGIQVVVEEHTERRQLEESRRREEEFRSLVENSTDIIVRYDRTLTRIYANPAIEPVFGRPREGIIGKTNREAGLPEDVDDAWTTICDRRSPAGASTPWSSGCRRRRADAMCSRA